MPKGTNAIFISFICHFVITQIIKGKINNHLNINRNTSNSFPQINDALRFCLQAEKAIKTNFSVHFGSGTINI